MNAQPRHDRSTEFPKMVYTPGLADWIIINSEEERPEGYYDHAEAKELQSKPKDDLAGLTGDKAKADLEAEQAKREAKVAEKAYRKEIMKYLDEHNVDYAKNQSTSKLEELKVKLDEYLGQQDVTDDDEQRADPVGVS